MPKLSVILPAYNAEKYIKEAVDSILNQTFSDFELLIINDASTDDTLEIILSYKDPRIKIINNSENIKVVKSLNKGIYLAQGEFIARMDADDISLPNRFESQLNYLAKYTNVDICGSWTENFGGKSHISKPYEFHEQIKAGLLFINIIVHPTIMFRKKSFEDHNLKFREEYLNAEDYGMWMESIDQLTFANIPEVLLRYRVHDNNVSVHKSSNWNILVEMNFKAYSQMLDKVGVSSYSYEDLANHMDLGFRDIKNIPYKKLEEYVIWLLKIVSSNNETKYINKLFLQIEVVSTLQFLISNMKKSFKAFLLLSKIAFEIYTISDYYSFFLFKVKNKFILKRY